MASLTIEAEKQVDLLVVHYLGKDRVEAVLRLSDAVKAALQAVDDPSTSWATFPRPYPALASERFRWIKRHRYWFAYTVDSSENLIHHLSYETADIVGRVKNLSR